MTGGRGVGDTLLIECLEKDLRYALSNALSPLPYCYLTRNYPPHRRDCHLLRAFHRATACATLASRAACA